MAKDYNQVIFTGRLGKDPEMRFTPAGKAVTNFPVASNTTTKRDGETQEDTEWFNVVAWEGLGEICNQYLTKGSRVMITGKQKTRSWVDTASGETKYKTECIASDMVMLDSAPAGERTTSAAARPAPPARPAAAPRTPEQRQRRPIVKEDDLPF